MDASEAGPAPALTAAPAFITDTMAQAGGAVKLLTLAIVHQGRRVLLGLKKRGFGTGRHVQAAFNAGTLCAVSKNGQLTRWVGDDGRHHPQFFHHSFAKLIQKERVNATAIVPGNRRLLQRLWR